MRFVRFLSFLVFIIVLHATQGRAQSPIVFYELIVGDSVALYFNKDFMFTEKDCYDYVRHVRITESGDFNGYFEDRSVDGRLLAKGAYLAGMKHGYFEIFYAHGSIYSRGYYENNMPVGNWEYYYPNGLLERTVTVSDSTVLLMRHIDETGTVKIENGSGKFDGVVRLAPEFRNLPMFAQAPNGMRATGKIIAGRPDGKWFIPDRNRQEYYVEKFDHGKLIKSSLVSKRKMKNNRKHARLDAFFLDSYLTTLEVFERESCSESQKYFFNRYPNDFRAFSFDLRQKMKYIIDTDLRSARKRNYAVGDNYMSVQFSVDNKGKPYDIKLVSDWGENFLKITQNSLNKTVFSTNSKTMYFHLKISYAGGYRYKYNFRFSKRDRTR
jgi:antitoxin component YwqK of YwqJK toxin-antitoxin module